MARLTCDGSGAWLKSLAKWEELTEFRNREGAPHGGGGGASCALPVVDGGRMPGYFFGGGLKLKLY